MQPATPCNTTARQQCTQFWVLPVLVLLALCTPLASAAREWAAQTWSEHLPRICTAILLYHAARNWASSLARRIPTLASTQAARHGPSPTSNGDQGRDPGGASMANGEAAAPGDTGHGAGARDDVGTRGRCCKEAGAEVEAEAEKKDAVLALLTRLVERMDAFDAR